MLFIFYFIKYINDKKKIEKKRKCKEENKNTFLKVVFFSLVSVYIYIYSIIIKILEFSEMGKKI